MSGSEEVEVYRNDVDRRDFMKILAGAGAALCAAHLGCSRSAAAAAAEAAAPAGETKAPSTKGPFVSDHEALEYEKLDGGAVHCLLCPRGCTVRPGQRGYCRVRENQGGTYKTLVYGRVCTAHVDPIEKKPLFHFLPGTTAFSIATAGCNVACQFCQNWEISQARPEDLPSQDVPPAKLVEAARRSGSPTVAFTYSEPTIFYEYELDAAQECKKAGLHSVTITNGFIRPEPMKRICEPLSAVKVDMKGFDEDFYRKYVNGELKPVLATIELVKKLGKHLELVTLLIPGLNDSEDLVKAQSQWVVKNLGPDVPVHFTRFHPAYKMTNLPQTPERTIMRAREIAVAEGVHYAYTGNLDGSEYENTFCHKCGKKIIKRHGLYVEEVRLRDGNCSYCGTAIPGVWKA